VKQSMNELREQRTWISWGGGKGGGRRGWLWLLIRSGGLGLSCIDLRGGEKRGRWLVGMGNVEVGGFCWGGSDVMGFGLEAWVGGGGEKGEG